MKNMRKYYIEGTEVTVSLVEFKMNRFSIEFKYYDLTKPSQYLMKSCDENFELLLGFIPNHTPFWPNAHKQFIERTFDSKEDALSAFEEFINRDISLIVNKTNINELL